MHALNHRNVLKFYNWCADPSPGFVHVTMLCPMLARNPLMVSHHTANATGTHGASACTEGPVQNLWHGS